jgi:hypothetical protein
MTRLQKRVYLLILRSLAIMLFYRLHHPDPEMALAGDKLRGDLTELMTELNASLERGTP